ncbi:MAG: YifB family Mg chelatase-like AAA ATPase [Chloroflexi bacterium]|nr:YifB family Mg chelatase-like AAA ATPase [Chloroflexota bacterium]MCH8114671.1 YifB family Mg chelatase-like AAA ATPase [Chloroflexota bacterium]MCI0774933.1 YifB family Mg chelatase-like AAA ATPase [Chloroflexota bacterium]MCI0803679.1 YifB family Mg chelatase-like AAA ATPase [Chloroflexota bacterium]MCI0808126.1 YifB family Mg chelatase-like AAA ATPase [Chloroflexota bacterium]
MLAKTRTCALIGLDGIVVETEVDIAPGLPAFHIVGLPDTALQESRERVRAAIRNSGVEFPMRRIAVSLAPANVRKSGPAYDLPIAIGILTSTGQVPEIDSSSLLLGELALDGSLRPTMGMLPMVAVGKRQGFSRAFVPEANAEEAALVDGIEVMPVKSLTEMIAFLRSEQKIDPIVEPVDLSERRVTGREGPDISDVRGQEHAKRAIEVAAAGRHNLLMAGPPGSGKTLLARSLPSILPSMTAEEALDVTTIYSVAGHLPADTPMISERPFRAPHYTISNAGLVGGGVNPRPGEITLSHRGVLFLDELPEFGHASLEVLRQPIEDKVVTISRAQGTTTFPANFMLVAAMNPCPCGYSGDLEHACSCSPSSISRYRRRISGPLLDRFDIFVDVPRVEYEKLVTPPSSENSDTVRERISRSIDIQRKRFAETGLNSNSDMGPVEVWDHCAVEDSAQSLLQMAMKQLTLSARGLHRVLKVARTIADLAGSPDILTPHVAEALQYRPRQLV